MKKDQNGFGIVGVLLIVVLAGLMGFVGWRVYAMNTGSKQTESNASKSPATSNDSTVISFTPEASFSHGVKQEILTKVVNPFIYFHEESLKIKIRGVVVDPDPGTMGPDDYRYRLTYHYANSQERMGFLFGAKNRIGYWQPPLCDPGGCMPYPDDFKQKYPITYQAYQECQAATTASDKDKMNLVCAP